MSRDRNYCVFGQIKSTKYSVGTAQFDSASSLSRLFIDDMLGMTCEQKTTKDGKLTLTQVPKNNIVIKSVSIDEKGTDYSKAKVAKA